MRLWSYFFTHISDCQVGEIQRSIDGFESICGFPQVAGAIDGTHIEIRAPTECPEDFILFSYKQLLIHLCALQTFLSDILGVFMMLVCFQTALCLEYLNMLESSLKKVQRIPYLTEKAPWALLKKLMQKIKPIVCPYYRPGRIFGQRRLCKNVVLKTVTFNKCCFWQSMRCLPN